MSTTGAFVPISLQTLVDRNGIPIVGGMLFAYDAGTTTARPLYSDAAVTTALPTPIKTDGFGRWPVMFADVGAYKIVIQDAEGGLLSTADGLPGGTVNPTTPGTTTGPIIPPGFYMAAHVSDIIDGWLIANGKSIGNASTGATARAAADALPLFTALWNNDAGLVVTGGRGLSALADFNAGKMLTLPDMRSLGFLGRDTMGATARGYLTAATSATPDLLGLAVGAELITLTKAQTPALGVSVSVNAGGAFTPAGTLDSQGAHVHSGNVDGGGAHTHVIETTQVTASVGGTARGISAPGLTDQSTDSIGTHTHSFTTGSAGAHVHTFTGTAVSAHTHTATATTDGGGGAHPNVQPSMLVTIYIKL